MNIFDGIPTDENQVVISGAYNPITNELFRSKPLTKPTKKVTPKVSSTPNTDGIDWVKEMCLDIMKNNKFQDLLDLGWTFKWGTAKLAAGVCRFKTNRMTGEILNKSITISKYCSERHTKEMIENTITHEIAHAIDVEQRGTSDHSFLWANIHKELGGNGERTYEDGLNKEYLYVGVCETHGEIGGWFRKPKLGVIRSCKKCGKVIKIVKK
jgi:predicted SprT family Zn-dependent metalloprotease